MRARFACLDEPGAGNLPRFRLLHHHRIAPSARPEEFHAVLTGGHQTRMVFTDAWVAGTRLGSPLAGKEVDSPPDDEDAEDEHQQPPVPIVRGRRR